MRQRCGRAGQALAIGTVLVLATVWDRAHTRPDEDKDRGANVVETIIIVAGFAILAAAIYSAVSGKVHAWISKIP